MCFVCDIELSLGCVIQTSFLYQVPLRKQKLFKAICFVCCWQDIKPGKILKRVSYTLFNITKYIIHYHDDLKKRKVTSAYKLSIGLKVLLI
jgi:hypothetical protein